EGGGEEDQPELPGVGLKLGVFVATELERLSVLSVGGAEAVLVVVRSVVGGAGEERPVVALLQLDGVDAAVTGGAEELLRLLHAALVVVADLRDHEAGALVRDRAIAENEPPGVRAHARDGTRPADWHDS